MSVLRTIESKLESLFEGVFGRAFRTNAQPVELARTLVKEMDDHRSVSVSRVYVPNEHTIYLSPEDRDQRARCEDSLLEQLQDDLAEHARRGRSRDCDIQIADPNVSRRHAEVRRDGGAYVLVDLDSTNGIEVDGKRVKRLELGDGSRFTIGSTEVVFSEELA